MAFSNLSTGPAAGANFTLETLRQQVLPEREIQAERNIVPGLRFVPDPDAGMSGQFKSPAGRLLEIEVTTERPARWFGLHLTLDAQDLSERGLVGFAARATAPRATAVTACLRSGRPGGFSDCFLSKALLAQPESFAHLDALDLARQEELPERASWREFILFLPTRNFILSLQDLRIFVV